MHKAQGYNFTELDVYDIRATRETKPGRNGQTLCGYGKNLPSRVEIQTQDKRWHRVRVICFSNSGSAYITIKGKTVFCENAVEAFKLKK